MPFFGFLSDNPKLSIKAKKHIKEAEKVIVPSIVLMEILYLLEKNHLAYKFVDVLSELKIRQYLVYPLDLDVIAQTLSLDLNMEMHDRIIVATAHIFNAFLISKDTIIRNTYPKTIW
ncbi:MAG: type II toxin-antitoxin system VapC family toxin [Candidatus Anammoxibacter sp.]